MAREILTDWTDEALDAGISQLKALRFSTGLSVREQMKIVLHAAERAQREAEIDRLVAGAFPDRKSTRLNSSH